MAERAVTLSLDISALRSSLGLTEDQLPDDATDAQINEVLGGVKASQTPEPPKAPEPKKDDKDEDDDDASKAKVDPPRQVPGGLVVDAAMWEQTQTELATVRAEREKRELREDQEYLTKAVRAGKIPPARVDHYMTLMKADRDGTREFVDKLPESLPTEHLGTLGDLEDTLKASDYPEQWLAPAERRRVEAAKAAYSEGRVGDVEPGTIIREA